MTPPAANRDPVTDPGRFARHTLVSHSITSQHDRAEADRLLTEHLAHLERLHRNGAHFSAEPLRRSAHRHRVDRSTQAWRKCTAENALEPVFIERATPRLTMSWSVTVVASPTD
jgi:hypothetical protein